MKILLIRHAKTQGNTEKRYIGSKTDEPVLKDELTRLEDIRRILKGRLEDDCLIFSSPLLRCTYSAKVLTGRDDIGIIDEFREMDFGDFEGHNYEELCALKDYRMWINSEGKLKIAGTESIDEFKGRSIAAFKRIVIKNQDAGLIVIVCHGGTIMSIMSELTGKDYYDFMVPNLDGYYLETYTDGRKTDVVSYSRFSDWISS